MTLLEHLDQLLREALRQRQGPRRDALRLAKVAVYGSASDADARLRLERYRRRCLAELLSFAAHGARGEPLADALVVEVGVCDELLGPLTLVETEALVDSLAVGLGLDRGALVREVLRVAPGRVDPRVVRELADARPRR